MILAEKVGSGQIMVFQIWPREGIHCGRNAARSFAGSVNVSPEIPTAALLSFQVNGAVWVVELHAHAHVCVLECVRGILVKGSLLKCTSSSGQRCFA